MPWRRGRLPTPVFLGFPGSSDGNEATCNTGDLGSIPGLGRSAREGKGYPLQYSWASLVAQLVNNLPAIHVDLGLIPGLGRSPGEGKGYPLQYSGLENSMDRGTWQATVHGVLKSWTRLDDFHSLYSSFPRCVHTSVLYICISIPALKIGSPVPFGELLLIDFFSHPELQGRSQGWRWWLG